MSDLHSNVPALQAVLDDIAGLGVEQIACLGDIVDLGPEPGAVIRLLQERSIPCLMGNHDPFNGEAIVPVEVYAWTRSVLSETELEWLRALPSELSFEFESRLLLCVHGSPRSFDEQILPDTSGELLQEMLEGREFDVLACGHTHVQLKRRWQNRLVVNCGSVGMPFEAPFTGAAPPRVQPWAEYAVVELSATVADVDLRRVDYDVEEYFERVRRSTMPEPEAWIGAWLSR